jgi:hypothetical protein
METGGTKLNNNCLLTLNSTRKLGRMSSSKPKGVQGFGVLSKALHGGGSWTKEEAAELNHWVKQALGLTAGLVCGVVGVEGFVGAILSADVVTVPDGSALPSFVRLEAFWC